MFLVPLSTRKNRGVVQPTLSPRLSVSVELMPSWRLTSRLLLGSLSLLLLTLSANRATCWFCNRCSSEMAPSLPGPHSIACCNHDNDTPVTRPQKGWGLPHCSRAWSSWTRVCWRHNRLYDETEEYTEFRTPQKPEAILLILFVFEWACARASVSVDQYYNYYSNFDGTKIKVTSFVLAIKLHAIPTLAWR